MVRRPGPAQRRRANDVGMATRSWTPHHQRRAVVRGELEDRHVVARPPGSELCEADFVGGPTDLLEFFFDRGIVVRRNVDGLISVQLQLLQLRTRVLEFWKRQIRVLVAVLA